MSAEGNDQKKTPQGAPCWIEIPAKDTLACKNFYSGLFPSWKFRPGDEEYKEENMIMYMFEKPDGLGGGIMKVSEECKASEQSMGQGMTVYYFVNSVEESEARVKELGGKTVLPKTQQGKDGWFANFLDTQGNRFGVYELNQDTHPPK